MELKLELNGSPRSVAVEPTTTLLSVIRDTLGLLGTKEGCNEGECGSCTALVDGVPVDTCLYPAMAADGAAVVTVEGVADHGRGADVQASMLECGGVQCGFCTPGVVMTLTALLEANPTPDDDEIRESLAGNICRCTGYSQIVDAVNALTGGESR